jgi:RNA polymerase sigma factor (sigma-70 family)
MSVAAEGVPAAGEFHPRQATPSNEALLRAAAAGDPGAWDGLTARFGRLVWSVARGFELSGADAADLCQTAWLRLVEHLEDIKDPERLGSWLATTVRREAIKLLRRSMREIPAERFALTAMGDFPEPSAEEYAIAAEERAALMQDLHVLSQRTREVVELLAQDQSVGAVAEQLGISPSTVRGHVFQARRQLARADTGRHPARHSSDRQERALGQETHDRVGLGQLPARLAVFQRELINDPDEIDDIGAQHFELGLVLRA